MFLIQRTLVSNIVFGCTAVVEEFIVGFVMKLLESYPRPRGPPLPSILASLRFVSVLFTPKNKLNTS